MTKEKLRELHREAASAFAAYQHAPTLDSIGNRHALWLAAEAAFQKALDEAEVMGPWRSSQRSSLLDENERKKFIDAQAHAISGLLELPMNIFSQSRSVTLHDIILEWSEGTHESDAIIEALTLTGESHE